MIFFIEDDLDLPWEYVAVLEADFILWVEAKMDSVRPQEPFSFQDSLDYQS